MAVKFEHDPQLKVLVREYRGDLHRLPEMVKMKLLAMGLMDAPINVLEMPTGAYHADCILTPAGEAWLAHEDTPTFTTDSTTPGNEPPLAGQRDTVWYSLDEFIEAVNEGHIDYAIHWHLTPAGEAGLAHEDEPAPPDDDPDTAGQGDGTDPPLGSEGYTVAPQMSVIAGEEVMVLFNPDGVEIDSDLHTETDRLEYMAGILNIETDGLRQRIAELEAANETLRQQLEEVRLIADRSVMIATIFENEAKALQERVAELETTFRYIRDCAFAAIENFKPLEEDGIFGEGRQMVRNIHHEAKRYFDSTEAPDTAAQREARGIPPAHTLIEPPEIDIDMLTKISELYTENEALRERVADLEGLAIRAMQALRGLNNDPDKAYVLLLSYFDTDD